MSNLERGSVVAGRFVIEGKLASGGMASVYVATMRLARGVERQVVIKRVHPHLAEDTSFITMFVDEARLAAQLRHPGVIPTLDAVEDKGELLLVLDYVPGWDLSAVLRARREPWPVGSAVRVARLAAETLAYVHEAVGATGRPLEVVHRDVTPSNILVAEDGSVRLLDFGVAKAAERLTRTATQGLKGKFGYMAPEQARGQTVDSKVDCYALGLVIREMLTGRKTIRGATSIDRLTAAQNPSFPRVLESRPDTPPPLAAIVESLLSIDPAARPTSREAAQRLGGLAALETGAESLVALVADACGSGSRPMATEGARDSAVDAAFALILGEEAISVTRDIAPTSTARSLLHETGAVGERIGSEPPTVPDRTVPDRTVPDRTVPDAADLSVSLESVDEIAAAPRWRGVFILGLLVSVLGAAGFGVWLASVGPSETGPDGSGSPSGAGSDAPTATTGFLRVTSEPAGAHLVVDGVALEDATPAVVEVAAGAHQLELSIEGYRTNVIDVDVPQGSTERLEVALERAQGTLAVTTDPGGARVRIDGDVVGDTPLEFELPTGEHRLELSARGWRSVEPTVVIRENETTTLELALQRVSRTGPSMSPRSTGSASGSLAITIPLTLGTRATAYIDGRALADRSVPIRHAVAPGVHSVRVRLPDGREQTQQVRVAAGESKVVAFFR